MKKRTLLILLIVSTAAYCSFYYTSLIYSNPVDGDTFKVYGMKFKQDERIIKAYTVIFYPLTTLDALLLGTDKDTGMTVTEIDKKEEFIRFEKKGENDRHMMRLNYSGSQKKLIEQLRVGDTVSVTTRYKSSGFRGFSIPVLHNISKEPI